VLDGLVFGWRTAVLFVAAIILLAIAIALSRTMANRVANRTLAALLAVLIGIGTPWMIGFAGLYDKWRWLSFAPFQITLAVGPLIWLYLRALIEGAWPPRGWRHLAPAALQFSYGAFCFLVLPTGVKDRWLDLSGATFGRVFDLATIFGLAAYGIDGLRRLRAYRAALVEARSDDHRYAARWLAAAIGATLILAPVWATYVVWDAFVPLGYAGLMGLYVAVAAFALFLAIEGWRHAHLPFPRLVDLVPAPVAETRDWAALGIGWAKKTRAEGWHRDPDLSLAVLGMSFSAFVARLRSEEVASLIEKGATGNLLDLAFEAGFSSKASFNRAFVDRYGVPPSAWRARMSQIPKIGRASRL
jgi:hypothetical protein